MYTCSFCGFSSTVLDDFEHDTYGFECPDCISYNYYNEVSEEVRHNFRLLLEKVDNSSLSSSLPSFKPTFPTRVSPLRYPGGKSKMVGQIYARTRKENMIHFAEPFAGGASVGLSLLLSGNIQELYLNELDYGIYSLFWTIKNNPEYLLQKISSFLPTKEAYYSAQKAVFSDYNGLSKENAGWIALVVNRLSFSGICKANCMSNPAARWNASTLTKRIRSIAAVSEHIHISNMDACSFIEEFYWNPNSTIFIDPPYYKKGKALYNKYYSEADHQALSYLLDELYRGMPGADMIVTYDNCNFIQSIYEYPLKEVVSRIYCIAN